MEYSQVDSSKTPGDPAKVGISIASKLDQVSIVRAALGGILEEQSVPEEDITLLLLAVTEVVNNAIEHGYRNQSDERVEILVVLRDHEIQIEVFDDAPPLPVSDLQQLFQAAAPDSNSESGGDQWGERGHGLQIVRRAVDSLDFSRIDDRNCVTLRRRVG